MNSLSWFLYSIDVLSNIKGFLIILVFFLGTGAIAYIGHSFVEGDHPPKWWIVALLLSPAVPLTLIPDKNTMYAIGASELGEHVVNSEIGQKAKKAIEMWIDSQLTVPTK